MPDPNYAALAAEGRRLLAIADKQGHAWPAHECCEQHDDAAMWMLSNIDSLLTACERFSLLEEANRKLSTSLRKHSDAVNEQAERLAKAEQRCAELAAALKSICADFRRWALEEGLGLAVEYVDSLNLAEVKRISAEHDAALFERLIEIVDDTNPLSPDNQAMCESGLGYIRRRLEAWRDRARKGSCDGFGMLRM